MTRRRWHAPAAALVAAAVFGIGWLGSEPQPAAEPVLPASDLPHVWQWKLHAIPDPGAPAELLLVLRQREDPLASDRGPPPADRPLRPGEGTDRVIGAEYLARPVGGPRVTLQLLDLRRFGIRATEVADPLRLTGVVRAGEAGWLTTTRLGGHSLRGQPVAHSDTWTDGELALITFSTISTEAQYVYTLLLTVRPDYR
jgi:hypothetical protein